MTSKGADQTAYLCRLILGFAGRTYHIVGNLTSWLIYIYCVGGGEGVLVSLSLDAMVIDL